MKVFISWSDKTSKKVAEVLSEWLPCVVQAIDPFISFTNIDKGERWGDELDNKLKQTESGIICLTRHNINAPWMNFEAGAISNAIQRSRVSPFLFHVDADQVTGPLQRFQNTVYGKDETLNRLEVLKLVSSINDTLGQSKQVPAERLKREFEMWWPDLKKKIDKVCETSEVESVAGFKWLFLGEDIIAMQGDSTEVWVIARQPFLDPDLKQVMKKIIERRGICRYVISG